MRTVLFLLSFLFLLACTNNSPAPDTPKQAEIQAEEPAVASPDKQLILVTAENSDTYLGEVSWYEKAADKWTLKGGPVSCTLGKNGMAWGQGKHQNPKDANLKKEGDKRTPKGIFTAGSAFGYAATAKFDYPYSPITDFTHCIEDSESAHYNTIVESTKTEKDWESADHMLRDDHLYKLGFFVDHNAQQQKEAGSCIFFHLYRAIDKPTAGCTAMAEQDLTQLLNWMNIDKDLKIVQITENDISFIKGQIDMP